MVDNAATEAVAEAIRKAIGAVETHGPGAVHLAGTYLQYNAIFTLLISATIVGALLYGLYRLWKWIVSECEKPEVDGESAVMVGIIVSIPLLVLSGVLTIKNILNFSLWVSLWSPELALMAKAISLLK